MEGVQSVCLSNVIRLVTEEPWSLAQVVSRVMEWKERDNGAADIDQQAARAVVSRVMESKETDPASFRCETIAVVTCRCCDG